METNSTDLLNPRVHEITKLLLRFLRRRPHVLIPEHMVRFREQMERIKKRSADDINVYQVATRIFVSLASTETPPTMKELSEDLQVPYSTATRFVDWLVEGDLVERIPDPLDRRIVRVRMAEKGKKFYETALYYLQHRIDSILQAFTPEEQDEMFRLFGKLLDVLE